MKYCAEQKSRWQSENVEKVDDAAATREVDGEAAASCADTVDGATAAATCAEEVDAVAVTPMVVVAEAITCAAKDDLAAGTPKAGVDKATP